MNIYGEDDYFDVKNYPKIRFVSTSIRATGKNGEYEATGTLTIKNKTNGDPAALYGREKWEWLSF